MIFVQILFTFLFNFSLIFIYIQTGAKQQNQLQQMTAGMMMQNQRAMVNTFFYSISMWYSVVAAKSYKLHIFLEGWSNNTKKKDDDGWNDEPATKSSGKCISEIFSKIETNCLPWIRLSDSAFIQLHSKDGMVARKATMMVSEYAYFNFVFFPQIQHNPFFGFLQ